MKRFLLTGLFAALILLPVSCDDQLEAEILELKNEIAQMEAQVSKMNDNIAELSNLLSSLEKNDHITSVKVIPGTDGKQYRVTFTSGTTLLLECGENGVSPILGVQYDEENEAYYWTIQMGPDGVPTWMTNSYGMKVRASGTVPRLKIEDGVWWYSYDGNSWNKAPNWAPAQGRPGQALFSNIDTSNPYYVTFTLSNGTRIFFPTQLAVEELTNQCEHLNVYFNTYSRMIEQVDSSFYITSVVEYEENGDRGCRITTGDGDVFDIRTGRDNRDSILVSAKRFTDGHYYWAWRNQSDPDLSWILYQGEKVRVTPADVTPVIGIADSLGRLYFTIAYEGGTPEFIRDASGNPVVATGSVVFDLIKDVDLSNPSVVVLIQDDGTEIRIPRTGAIVPTLTLSLRETVRPETRYSFHLLLIVHETSPIPFADFAAYQKATGARVEGMAIDDGYAEEAELSSFYLSSTDADGYHYEVIYAVPFTTGPYEQWGTLDRKSRIAVFYSWYSQTFMKVAEFTRTNPATSLRIIQNSVTVVEGGEFTLTVSYTPINTSDVLSWSSSDPSIATVNDNGRVTGIAAGNCTITATIGTLKASVPCTVTPAP